MGKKIDKVDEQQDPLIVLYSVIFAIHPAIQNYNSRDQFVIGASSKGEHATGSRASWQILYRSIIHEIILHAANLESLF